MYMKQVLPWMSNLVAPQEHLAMAQVKSYSQALQVKLAYIFG